MLDKKASSYTPGYEPGRAPAQRVNTQAAQPKVIPGASRIGAPSQGFGVRTAANPDPSGYPAHDPYSQYTQAVDMDQVWQALQTEAGRTALGAQMAIPIRTQLDYMGVERRFFEIDVLAQGQIARYDKDITGFAACVAKRAEIIDFIVEGEYVEPKTWEIFAPAGIRLSEIQQRRFNVLDRMQEKIRIQVQIQEDSQFLALCRATCEANTANNALVTISAATGVTKANLNAIRTEVQKWDLPCYAFLMNFKTYSAIMGWGSTDLDPVTIREILQSGLYARIWGIDIIVSRLMWDNWVFAMTEPRYFGVHPIRTDLILMPDDEPKRALVAYVGYEEIGQAIVNSNGIAYGHPV